MQDIINPAYVTNLRGKLAFNAPLLHFTSWRSGGPADCLYHPADIDDLSIFLQTLPPSVPITWLGLGSNTLIRNGGVEGVVIVTQGGLNKIQSIKPTIIRAEAGVASAQLARHSARLGASGIEFLAGIPGTVGGALAMNAGCFGGETWEYVTQVETINRQGKVFIRQPKEFVVNYRHVTGPLNEWFVAGEFTLKPSEKEISLQAIRNLLEKRNNTQPTGTANCGSVFRNPPGNFAGRLIESCGLKGKQLGGAQVSTKHANFILNDGKASSADIENLIYEVGAIVEQQTGVRLVPEVCIIGRA